MLDTSGLSTDPTCFNSTTNEFSINNIVIISKELEGSKKNLFHLFYRPSSEDYMKNSIISIKQYIEEKNKDDVSDNNNRYFEVKKDPEGNLTIRYNMNYFNGQNSKTKQVAIKRFFVSNGGDEILFDAQFSETPKVLNYKSSIETVANLVSIVYIKLFFKNPKRREKVIKSVNKLDIVQRGDTFNFLTLEALVNNYMNQVKSKLDKELNEELGFVDNKLNKKSNFEKNVKDTAFI